MKEIVMLKNSLFLIVCCLFFLNGISQTTDSARDVQWHKAGLTALNYRLITDGKNKGDLYVAAVTASNPGVEISVQNRNGQRVLNMEMTNRFDYQKSWMLQSEIHDTVLLKHEQGHFDINEIYTRKAFEQLKNFHFTKDFKNELAKIMTAMNRERSLLQRSYESETVHGLQTEKQEQWNKRIARDLDDLPEYENKILQQTLPD